MKKPSWLRHPGLAGFILVLWVMAAGGLLPEAGAKGRGGKGEKSQASGLLRFSVHDHILPYVGRGESDFPGGARTALQMMDQYGIEKMILMPHPFIASQADAYSYKPLKMVAEKYPDRFMFFGGGGTLNILLHKAVAASVVSPELREEFEKTAEKIIADGAIGFGEIAVEHFSMTYNHPYESAPADHQLLLLLSDIAARYKVPIDIHMEAIATGMDRPPGIPDNNPAKFAPNIEQFERLLSHNRQTSIIWAHAGWDNTGQRTTALMRQLLERHPNLYMSIKMRKKDGPGGGGYNFPLEQGEIEAGWLAVMKDFPDRFMIGNDDFYQPPQARDQRGVKLEGPEKFLSALPEELARRIGYENAARLFKIKAADEL